MRHFGFSGSLNFEFEQYFLNFIVFGLLFQKINFCTKNALPTKPIGCQVLN